MTLTNLSCFVVRVDILSVLTTTERVYSFRAEKPRSLRNFASKVGGTTSGCAYDLSTNFKGNGTWNLLRIVGSGVEHS